MKVKRSEGPGTRICPHPISKKAPGDRQFTDEEIEKIANLIMESGAEGRVVNLPGAQLKKALSLFRSRPAPPILEAVDPEGAKAIVARIAKVLRRKEIRVKVVDLGDDTGFPRDNARPSSEVLLLERKGRIFWPGKKRDKREKKDRPTIYITSAFLEAARENSGLLLQTIIHPILEWELDLPHMIAVLCESNYNLDQPEPDEDVISDLNRFIAEEAARVRDLAYFDRILGTKYEPDEFRIEELKEWFGPDIEKRNVVVYRARALGRKYRKLMEDLLEIINREIAREHVGEARVVLDGGDPERALSILRKIHADPTIPDLPRGEISDLIEMAIRSYSMGSEPAYEGLRLEKGEVKSEPWAGEKAGKLAHLLNDSIKLVKKTEASTGWKPSGRGRTDPLGEGGATRIIHVLSDLERPSAKFIDGHDRVHWVFEISFVESLLAGYESGQSRKGISATMACRFIRDGAFPDEKLKIDRQYHVAVKGALEGYRFYQALSRDTRAEMSAFYGGSGINDPLYDLFLSLGEETNVAAASRMIKDAVGKTHSFNYVRYPDTSLSGKVICITGGGTGMGRALALEAAIRGGNVVIMGRRPTPLEETRADMDDLISHLGLKNRTFIVQGDVSDPKYVGEMFDRISEEFGRIDVLYNNAGVSGPVEFGSTYQEEHFDQYRDVINIHLTGSWLASLEAAKIMRGQPDGGLIVMVGTFYSESIHRHVLHAYPGRLPYTSAQSAKLALGDYLSWVMSADNVSVVSLNPAAVATERIERGSGVFDKGSRARAKIGRMISPDALEKDTLDRTVSGEFVNPRDFARVALDAQRIEYRRTVGGQRMPMGGVTYEQPPGVFPSPAKLHVYPDMVGKVALVSLDEPFGNDLSLLEATVNALARAGAHVVLGGELTGILEALASKANARGGEGKVTASGVNLGNRAEVQELFDGLPRIDLLLHFTGSVDWKRPLTKLSFNEWNGYVDRYGLVPRLLTWQAEKRMDRDGVDGTVIIVGPDLSGVPSIKERDLVQVFQAMLRPAVATESMERALMLKAHRDKTSPAHVSDINIGLLLPGRIDGRNKQSDPDKSAATILWLAGEGRGVSGAVMLPDEKNSLARLPDEPKVEDGYMGDRVVVVTGGIRNLGRAIGLRFANEKATVIASSRRPDPGGSGEAAKAAREARKSGDATLALMRSMGAKALWLDTDVSDLTRVKELVEEARGRFGRIDVFVNNAGAGGDFSLISDVMRGHRSSWESVMRSNFLGPWYATSLLREIMGGQEDGGAIVNVSTHYSDHPYLFRTIYTVSKIVLKALTQALGDSLSREGIFISDVAPSLIKGPRMDWVMRNYAEKFAEQFNSIEGFSADNLKKVKEQFVSSFDRSLALEKRDNMALQFIDSIGRSDLKGTAKKDMEAWYGRIKEWFGSTVPDHPPSNEQVADAVLYGAKNSSFMEDRFIGVTSLPDFRSFPPPQRSPQKSLSGRHFQILSIGLTNVDGGELSAAGNSIASEGGVVLQIVENGSDRGGVDILRPKLDTKKSLGKYGYEKITREIDLKDPRVIEPWLDSSLIGVPPASGSIIHVGTTSEGGEILSYRGEEMERFISHAGKALSLFGETIRSVEEGGHVIITVPAQSTGESYLIRAAVRQMVRTALAEQHFLYPAKKVNISLLSAPLPGEEPGFTSILLDILRGKLPASVETIPVGRERP